MDFTMITFQFNSESLRNSYSWLNHLNPNSTSALAIWIDRGIKPRSNLGISFFAPGLSPGILDDEVIETAFSILAVANDRYVVVDVGAAGGVADNALAVEFEDR